MQGFEHATKALCSMGKKSVESEAVNYIVPVFT